MMKVSVLYSDHTSTRQASELEYAASMHFSAAYLPSGSSDSLDAEQHLADTTSPPDRVTSTETHALPSYH